MIPWEQLTANSKEEMGRALYEWYKEQIDKIMKENDFPGFSGGWGGKICLPYYLSYDANKQRITSNHSPAEIRRDVRVTIELEDIGIAAIEDKLTVLQEE